MLKCLSILSKRNFIWKSKTLHPKIFGGILAANTQDHQMELKEDRKF